MTEQKTTTNEKGQVFAVSESGATKETKLARFDLIPTGPLTQLAEHYGRGAKKYADRNWEKGYDWHLSYAAMQRHLNAFWGGEDIDEETGSPHIIAAIWHGIALAEYAKTHPEFDNRPTTVAAREAEEKAAEEKPEEKTAQEWRLTPPPLKFDLEYLFPKYPSYSPPPVPPLSEEQSNNIHKLAGLSQKWKKITDVPAGVPVKSGQHGAIYRWSGSGAMGPEQYLHGARQWVPSGDWQHHGRTKFDELHAPYTELLPTSPNYPKA